MQWHGRTYNRKMYYNRNCALSQQEKLGIEEEIYKKSVDKYGEESYNILASEISAAAYAGVLEW